MSDEILRQQGLDIAEMKGEIKHLNKSFGEYKIENKEYHETQGRRFDELFEKILGFTQTANEILLLRREVNEITNRLEKIEVVTSDYLANKNKFLGALALVSLVLTVGEAILLYLQLTS